MHHRVIKICFVFLLMVTLLTSSPSFANIDSYLKDLDLDSARTVLRALNNKFKVNWSSEFKLNVPNRKEKTQKVLNFLTFILEERIKRINSLYIQKNQEIESSSSGDRLREWFFNKTRIYDEIKAKLAGECEKSDLEDRYAFECLNYRALPNEAPSTVEGGAHSIIIADPIIGDLVIVGPAEESLVAYETSMADFPTELPKELGDMVLTSSVVTPAPMASFSMSKRRAAKLSKKSLNSSHKPSKSIFSSLPLLGSSSMSKRRTLKLSKKPYNSSCKPSTPIVSSLPLVSISSTLIDIEEDSERTRLQQDMQDREDLLSKLDEKGVKIALQAILNNYLIPTQKFDFNNESDKDRYQHVHAYLNWILQNKMTNVLPKLSSADAENTVFSSYWYNKKLLEYTGRLEIIWGLFQQVNQPQVN